MPAVRTLFNGAPFQIYNPQPVAPKRHLTFTEKLKILDFYHEHKARLTQQQVVTRVKAMGYTSFAQSTLSGYLKDEPRIRAYMSANPSRLHFKQQTSVKLPEVEAALFEWIKQRHGGGIRLTGALICEKAREFCRLFDIPEAQTLKFSNGWLSRLKARFGLRVYKFHGEAASAPIDTLDTEVQRIKELIELYNARDVFNVDETALFFRLPPTTGLAFEQMSGIKADKIRLTYLLGANMDGSEKLKPLSIWHNFLSDLNTRMAQQHRHILLLIDNTPSHRHTASDYPNLRIEPLAPNLTAWIQPMDAGIIRCFKAHYRNGLTRLVLDRDNAGIEKIYNISQLEGMRLAAAAWDAVSASTIANCWRHTRLASTEESFAQTSDSELAATQTAQALQAEVMQHPNLLEPEFEQMMASLSISPPTERELTDQEIADGVSFVVSF
ncbi:tigger transposable element-derived protein 4 [Ceratobasidium sp. AG-Ba]|nr:tigger transposable element-derived protein 4 [Ceratobasidium sp. AG-Ba]